MKKTLLIIIWMSVAWNIHAQIIREPDHDSIRLAGLESRLSVLAEQEPAFREKVDIMSSRMSMADLLRNLARASGANLAARNIDNISVSCNFAGTPLNILLLFLCKEYGLDMDIMGNIVSVYPVGKQQHKPADPDIQYRLASSSLSLNLDNDPLVEVGRKITDLTGINIMVPTELNNTPVSGYIRDLSVAEAIRQMGMINGLGTIVTGRDVISFIRSNSQIPVVNSYSTYSRMSNYGSDQLHIDENRKITLRIGYGNIQDIITDLCNEMGFNCYFISPLNKNVSMFIDNVDFEDLLDVLMAGSQHSYFIEKGIYYFGTVQQDPEIFAVRTIPMVNRSVDNIYEVIPELLKSSLQLLVFPDQNSIIASGDRRQISRLENFLASVDVRVPLVTIEIMIVDVSKTDVKEAGIKMGVGKAATTTSGTLSPGVDLTLGAGTINNLINSFNGFGSVNLGKVTPDFYMGLKLMEENGNIELRSTPKLSTLNGHEANLKSGEKRYYKEVTSNIIGSQNPMQTESFVWRDVEANLTIRIKPFVSQDKNITLEIELEQSEFTSKEEDTAPPGISTRSFKSMVRVGNEEMVLLGGIDRNSHEKTSNGLPFISKVPVLRWFFGNSKNNKKNQRLSIFIKPTVIE